MQKNTARALRFVGCALLLFAAPLFAPVLLGLLLARLGAAAARRLPQALPAQLRRVVSTGAVCAPAFGLWLGLGAALPVPERGVKRWAPLLADGIARLPLNARLVSSLSGFADRFGRALLAALRLLRRFSRPDLPALLAASAAALLLAWQPDLLSGLLPEALRAKLSAAAASARLRVSAWAKRRLPRALAAFFCLWSVLFLLGLPYAAAAAGLLALSEAFPPLGAGLVVLPAALGAGLLGERAACFGLLALYGLLLLTRLGRERPAYPAPRRLLLALAAGYAGYRLCGLPGLLAGLAAAPLAGQLLRVQQDAASV